MVRSSRKKVIDKKRCLREIEFPASHTARPFPQKAAIMKMPSKSILIALVFSAVSGIQAQSLKSIDQMIRPRSVAGTKTSNAAKSKLQGQSTQQPTPSRQSETGTRSPEKTVTPNRQQQEESRSSSREDANSSRHLSPNRIRSRINEAQRLMKVHPVPTT